MKKILFLLLITVSLTSCSTDSNSDNNSFFNLNQGNLWVYKRYAANDGVNYTATNTIDTVRVAGDTLINSLSYVKLVHKRYNSDILYQVDKECLRVDSNGHLVNQNGLVYHPGTDSEFHSVRPITSGMNNDIVLGSLEEQLIEPFIRNIEGIDYFVYSYYGNFTPTDPAIANTYTFSEYKEGLGLVCIRCAAIVGPSSTEDRLVHYEVN